MSHQKQGVFWVIDGELYVYPFGSVKTTDGIAKFQKTSIISVIWIRNG